ncbi:hypothetical protein Tco_1418022 [Tanacetum coccineum]
MKEKLTDFVSPTKALGEAQEEEISPTILEATKTLSKVASQGVGKKKSTDKGKRYRRRARSMAKKIDIGLDAEEEINTGREEINTSIEEATHKTKEQIRQEEAGLEEAIKSQAQLDKEVAKQIHFDKMFYTEEDWDTIRAKLEANAELSKDTKTSKKQRVDDEDVPTEEDKVVEVKEEEPVKRTGKRKKQKARKGVNVDKSARYIKQMELIQSYRLWTLIKTFTERGSIKK